MAAQFSAGVYVDLAPIIDPGLVAVTATRALRVPDQPGRSTTETLLRFISNQHMLMVLDNCEHLLDATAALTTALLRACPRLTVLATSREPIGVPDEVTWRVPPLSLADDADSSNARCRTDSELHRVQSAPANSNGAIPCSS
jgi:predicted ATPase